MTTPLVCLIVVAFLPFVLSTVGGYLRGKELGTLDNKLPRVQAQALRGAGARAYAAQANAWEALGAFTALVAVAQFAGADPAGVAKASLLFLATRILHPIFYIADQDKLRSLVFLVGLGALVWMAVLSFQA